MEVKKVTFEDIGLSKNMQKAVADMGYDQPTYIQKESIPLIMEGRDITGNSQTGTGKTAAFAIPSLEKVDLQLTGVQILVLCPTRELAIQASDEFRKFGKYMHGIKTVAIYGGEMMERQIRALKQGVQIVVGTPGRVMDHMRRRTLKLQNVRLVILDEADEMLKMGFREDIETILKDTPPTRQTVLFSATMPKEILRISLLYQREPVEIKGKEKELTVPGVDQYFLQTTIKDKIQVLSRLLHVYDPHRSLVFCNTKKMTDETAKQLQEQGFMAKALHGDLSQSTRKHIVDSFKSGMIQILVATDVAARGLHIDEVEIVFNYDMPQDNEYYVHRIGRTARAGKTGKAFILIAGKKQLYSLKKLQDYTKTKIIALPIPSQKEIEKKRMERFLFELKENIKSRRYVDYLGTIDHLMDETGCSMKEIGATLMEMLYGKQDRDCERIETREDTILKKEKPAMARLFTNLGKKDRVKPKNIVGAIAEEAGIKGSLIGTIDVFDKYSFVDVPKQHAEKIMKALNKTKINGKRVIMEPVRTRA